MESNPRQQPPSLVLSPGLCNGQSRQGSPCRAPVGHGRSYCLAHDPDPGRRAEFLKLQAERGALGVVARRARLAKKRSSSPVPLASTNEIRKALEKALGAVHGAQGASALDKAEKVARICSVALSTLRTAELERELRELQEQVGQLQANKKNRAVSSTALSGETSYPVENGAIHG